MSFTDKLRNKIEEMKGGAREAYGDAADDDRMRAEGRADQTTAHAKQAGEHLKDVGRDVRKALD